MKKIFNYLSVCALFSAVLFTACQKDELPKNPTLQYAVSGLIINVSGEDYTAVPQLDANGVLSDVMLLDVKIPSRTAKIVQIDLADGLTTDVKAGDEIQFEDNMFALQLYRNGVAAEKYLVEMNFNPPPFYYFIKSSDRDADGNRYYLNLDNPQTIASGTYDNHFEGEIDLTTTNWDNIGIITSDQKYYYDFAGGPWPALSEYSWTGVEKVANGSGYFSCDGPWNDWLVTNGNPDIVSPGVWRVEFDKETFDVHMTMTQWAVSGSATNGKLAMTYSADSRTWSLTTSLSAGTLRFVTIPVTFGDSEFDLGLSSGISELGAGGDNIQIAESGNYLITLCLSNPPYYTYSVTKQ